jgi:hypothetical protein
VLCKTDHNLSSTIEFFKKGARRAGLGKLAFYIWYRPYGFLRQMTVEGGPRQQAKTQVGKLAMQEAAGRLPELVPPDEAYPVPVRFLSGEAYWYQTVFCLVSLQRVADRRVDAIIYDDGTLSSAVQERILRVVPWVRFVLSDEIAEQIEVNLPQFRYPALRARREVYPHIRKLTDLHDPGKPSLVLDSDMLFFRRPRSLLNWMADPVGVIYMEDAVRSYGYSKNLLERLARGAVPEKMNVGLYGLPIGVIDFDYLEYCCREMILIEGGNYFQEQALTALLVSGQSAYTLPRSDYCVLPDLTEGRTPTAALHHYVAQSKRSYFQFGWQRIFAEQSGGR